MKYDKFGRRHELDDGLYNLPPLERFDDEDGFDEPPRRQPSQFWRWVLYGFMAGLGIVIGAYAFTLMLR